MNRNIGSSFDDYLAERGILDEVSALAMKCVIAWKFAEGTRNQNIDKRPVQELPSEDPRGGRVPPGDSH